MAYTNEHGGQSSPKPERSQGKRNKVSGKQTEYRARDRAIAAGIPAKRVIMSGAVKNQGLDGDLDLVALLAEIKGRKPIQLAEDKSIGVRLAWWAKVREEAALSGRPACVWVHPKGATHDFIIMDDEQFLALVLKAINVSGEAQ